MTELKTLRDLEHDTRFNSSGKRIHESWVTTERLKAEAVKWIKYGMDFDSKIVFMQFFNITAEDLK